MTTLYDLIQSIDVLEYWNRENLDIKGIAYDSKDVKTEFLFVAIKGYQTDGHKYVFQAIKNGAIALIVEDYQEGWDIPQFKVENSRLALALIGDRFYNHPSKDLKTIGITATNGKTSTAFMTNAILEENNLKTALLGTVMVKFDDYIEPSILTTPESLNLHHYFYEMKNRDITHATMEVSSSALELHRVGGVDFDIVTLNNISREHIDLHGSFEEYFEAKSSLIKNAGRDKWAVLNLDDPYSASLVHETKAQVLTVGVDNKDAHIVCENLDLSTGRGQFTVSIKKPFLNYKSQDFDIELGVPGYHSVYNSMVAIAIGLLSHIPISKIQSALKNFKGVERRFQFIFEDDFKIIDDHFANIGNINVTLETLNFMDYNDLQLVYAIRGGRGVTTNRENAQTIVKWAEKLGMKEIIAALSRSHAMKKDKVIKEELVVFLETMAEANIKVHLYPELSEAISHGLDNVKKGDVLLLAGCQGMDYGAQIALEQLYNKRPYLDKDLLFAPLEDRVAGIN